MSAATYHSRLQCFISVLMPPFIYGAISVSAHLCRTPSFFCFILILILVSLIFPWHNIACSWCGRKYGRHDSRVNPPAYASIIGHFSTAIFVYAIRLLPVIKVELSLMFLISSCGFVYYLMRVINTDPGCMSSNSVDAEEIGASFLREKFCHYCSASVVRYDHHCAAVQNCIGRRNHRPFLLLLGLSCVTEFLYVICCYIYLSNRTRESTEIPGVETSSNDAFYTIWQAFFREGWLLSTSIFVAFQVVWQLPFLIFHIYLVSVNLTTHEWVNWESLPSFYEIGLHDGTKIFVNPYDKGFLNNWKAMIQDWR